MTFTVTKPVVPAFGVTVLGAEDLADGMERSGSLKGECWELREGDPVTVSGVLRVVRTRRPWSGASQCRGGWRCSCWQVTDAEPEGDDRKECRRGAVVELRRRQVATEREVAEVRSLATAADEKASEALARFDGSQGYCTVVGYYRRHDRRVSIALAAQHGRALAHQCRELGIEVCTVADERHGRVNTYPVPTLDEYFARVWAAVGN